MRRELASGFLYAVGLTVALSLLEQLHDPTSPLRLRLAELGDHLPARGGTT